MSDGGTTGDGDTSGDGGERIEVQRTIKAEPARIFSVLRDPQGHVTVDASGMLMDATGEAPSAVGDEFVVHMDREALNDFPIGRYDVTVLITAYEPDQEIAWTVRAEGPPLGHVYGYALDRTDGGTVVTHYYDWSGIDDDMARAGIFPVISESSVAGHARDPRADAGAAPPQW